MPLRFSVAGLRLRSTRLRSTSSLFLLPWLLVACGGSTQATRDAGADASAPVDAAPPMDAGPVDAPFEPAPDAPPEAAGRDASAPAVVLYSGDGEGFYDDTWEWDGTTWTQLQAPTPAQSIDGGTLGRSGHTMAGLGTQVVLFGGTANPSETDLGDTWTWDGIAWTQKAVAGPPPRDGHAMATLGDSKIVMYGGCNGSFPTDTWEWDGTAWTQVAQSGPNPGGRCGAAMASLGTEVVLFGGVGANPDTWLFDGTAWTQSSATGPGMRAFHAMGSLGGKVVLFGGEQDANTYLDDTWVFDGTTWTQLSIPGPAARFHHAMAPLDGVLVLFGGGGPPGGTPWYGDTWTFDGTAWTQVASTGPVGRLVYTLAAR